MADIPTDETGTAALAHGLGAVGFLFLCFGWVGPLIVYLTAKPEQPFVLMFLCVGFITFVVVWIMNLVFPILAAVAAKRGEWYRYPINIRMVSGAVG